MPAILLAARKFELIKKYALKNFTLWDVFAREKDMKTDVCVDLQSFTTRLVLSTEHYQTLLLSYFFQKLMVSIESFGKPKFNIKSEYDGSKAFKLFKRTFEFDYIIDADWPKFDSSIDSEYLLAAGAIMFSNCYSTKETLRVIFHIISSFITKYVVLPPGIVIELNRGNPSGHPGVTAINCYVNIIRWIQIGIKVYGPKYYEYMDIEVYGDDAYVLFKQNDKLIEIDDAIKDLGFADINVYDRLFPTSLIITDSESSPDFLKRKIGLSGLKWNKVKVLDKLIYQSKKRNIIEQIEIIKNFVITAPGDNEFNNFMKYLINDIIKVNNLKNLSTIDDIDNFLTNVKRYELADKSYFKSYSKMLNVLFKTMQVYIPRVIENTEFENENWFNVDIIKAYFLICENGIITRYLRRLWDKDIVKRRLIISDYELDLIKLNSVHRAIKDFSFLKLKG